MSRRDSKPGERWWIRPQWLRSSRWPVPIRAGGCLLFRGALACAGLGAARRQAGGFPDPAAVGHQPARLNPSRQLLRRRGFTLVELVLVMTLLIVVVSIAAPSLASFFKGRTLDSEARRLLSLTRLGQSRAVFEGVPMVLWLDQIGRAYGLEEEAGYTQADTKAVEFTVDKDLELEVINATMKALTNVNNNLILGNSPHGQLPAIRFLPDGSIADSSPENVRLRAPDGEELGLQLARNRLRFEIRSRTNQFNL